MKDLNELLSSETSDISAPAEPVAEPAAPVAESSAPAAPQQPRDEGGRFAPKGDEPGAPPAPTDRLPSEEFKGLKDERQKRQSAEQRAQELERQLAEMQNPPPPAPSIWDDEQGAFQHFGGQVVSQAVQQATARARLDMSEMMARSAHADFEEVWDPMNQFLTQNPVIIQQANESKHPWDYAYRAYKNATTMQELGATDLDAVRAKIREEIMAELAGQQQPAPAPTQNFPTLSNQQNAGQRSGPAWAGPKSLSDMLK